jgi:hypothetical protein
VGRSILGPMAKSAASGKPAKLTREEKKAVRAQKKVRRRETWKNLKQAFTLTRKQDPKFLPFAILYGAVAAAVLYVLGVLLTGSTIFPIPFAVLGFVLGAMITFSRRAQKAMFTQAEGQPGAAGYMLQQQLRGDWRLEQGIAGTGHLDAVHRLVGRAGIVLVGEGAPHRVRGLIAQEKKKIARVVGDTPIYDITVGDEPGQVPLRKLSSHVMKLPRNLSAAEVNSLGRRMSALGGARMPVPGGPLPGGKQMSVSQRQVRRR